MWPLKKKQPPKVGVLSNVAHARWLRAGSPHPEIEFLVLGEDQQEALAQVGDEYLEDCAAVHAAAIAELVQGIVAGLEGRPAPGGSVDEADYAEDLARQALAAGGRPSRQAAQEAARGRPLRAPATMGGVKKRRQERILADQEDRDAPLRLLGFKPDSLKAQEARERGDLEPFPELPADVPQADGGEPPDASDREAYIESLENLDPEVRRRLLEGDWDDPEAGAAVTA